MMVGIVPDIIHEPTSIPISINIITGTPIWRMPTAISASILFHEIRRTKSSRSLRVSQKKEQNQGSVYPQEQFSRDDCQ